MRENNKGSTILEQGRILTWDIETTDFKADFGHMLMWAGKFTDEEHVHYFRIDDSSTWSDSDPRSRVDDGEVVQTFVDLLADADMLVHHYGDKFDWPFLTTRCFANGIEPPAPMSTVDTCKIARSALAMGSNRLGNLAEFFNDEDAQKGGLSKLQWKLASQGDRETLDAMMEYCIDDVIATEGVYLKLRQVMRHHPNMAPVILGEEAKIRCPACGSSHTHVLGTRRTTNQIQFRRRCQECGHAYIGNRTGIPKGA